MPAPERPQAIVLVSATTREPPRQGPTEGLLGVSLAFGLTVLTMACAIGLISGCHLNPAVSMGLWAGGRFPAGQCLPSIVSQVLGGKAGGGVLLPPWNLRASSSACRSA